MNEVSSEKQPDGGVRLEYDKCIRLRHMAVMADVLTHKWLSLPKLAISISSSGDSYRKRNTLMLRRISVHVSQDLPGLVADSEQRQFIPTFIQTARSGSTPTGDSMPQICCLLTGCYDVRRQGLVSYLG